MPLESSRATRQARYRARMARAAFGLPAASAATSGSGTGSAASIGSANTSRSPTSSCRSDVPDRAARSRRRISASLMSKEAVTLRWSCSIRFR